MKSVVVDANVIVKWIFPERPDEDHQYQAIHLLQAIKNGHIKVYQPPHWMAEVTSVVVHLNAVIADEAVDLLYALQFPVLDEPEIYHMATKLAERFNHHLFDTLYHATALYGDYIFVTADDKYYRKAHKTGAILRLKDFYKM